MAAAPPARRVISSASQLDRDRPGHRARALAYNAEIPRYAEIPRALDTLIFRAEQNFPGNGNRTPAPAACVTAVSRGEDRGHPAGRAGRPGLRSARSWTADGSRYWTFQEESSPQTKPKSPAAGHWSSSALQYIARRSPEAISFAATMGSWDDSVHGAHGQGIQADHRRRGRLPLADAAHADLPSGVPRRPAHLRGRAGRRQGQRSSL